MVADETAVTITIRATALSVIASRMIRWSFAREIGARAAAQFIGTAEVVSFRLSDGNNVCGLRTSEDGPLNLHLAVACCAARSLGSATCTNGDVAQLSETTQPGGHSKVHAQARQRTAGTLCSVETLSTAKASR